MTKKMGRPKKKVTRSASFLLNLYPKEMKILKETSEKYHMSISDCIRASRNLFFNDPAYTLSHYGYYNDKEGY